MKKLIFFLLFPILLNAQVEFLGIVKFDTVYFDNSIIYDFLLKFNGQKTKDGSEVLFIPVLKVFNDVPRYAMLIEGYFCEYTYDEIADDVTIEIPECWLVEYNLKTKQYKEKKKYNNDSFDSFKPKDLKKKVKDKHKEKFKKTRFK